MYAKTTEEKRPIDFYLKAYCKLSLEEAKKLAESLHTLNNVKITDEDIVKVIDFLPKDAEEVHKLFSHVSLSEEEVASILNCTKEF